MSFKPFWFFSWYVHMQEWKMVGWNCMGLLGELLIYCLFLFDRRFSQNCENRLLVFLCLSVCLSVRPLEKDWAPTGRIFMNLDKFIFQKLCRKKNEVPLNCVNNSGCYTWRPICIYRCADKSLARPGRKQARKHVRDAWFKKKIETRAVIKFLFPAREGAEGIPRRSDRNICLVPSW